MASQVSETEYNLLLQNDVNTFGRTQWFFFRVTNCEVHQKVKFNIVNLDKSKSLFTKGMQISIYSEKNAERTNSGWHRGGTQISYTGNNLSRPNGKPYYTLSFTYEFQHESDTVFFAYSVPYTYSDLLSLLDSYEKDSRVSQILLRVPLCRTIGQNIVYLLTITAPGTREELKKKKLVFISARVHPGETVSSFVMKGVLKFITGISPQAQMLRQKFVFKIIPMLNPDGVINGNNRCSLLGVDLNRRWKSPISAIHPEIFYYKKLITACSKTRQIAIVADFHGHSIKHNTFVYGCSYLEAPHICKVFPFLLSQNSEFFSFADCNFSVDPSKQQTLRVVLFKELGVDNSFTVESSFCGSNFGKYKDMQLTSKLLKSVGKEFCKGLLMLEDCLDVPRTLEGLKSVENGEFGKVSENRNGFIGDSHNSVQFALAAFVENEKLLRTGESECSGSDSEDSEDCLDDRALIRKIKKKKKIEKMSKSSKFLSPGKCRVCGKIEYADHVCVFLAKRIGGKMIKTPNFPSPAGEERKKLESPQKLRISVSPSRPKLSETDSKTKIAKVRSEALYKSEFKPSTLRKINEKFTAAENSATFIKSDSKIQVKEFSVIEKLTESKGSNSISPIRGVHLLGIIEGVQCKLQKISSNRGIVFRRNHN